MPGRQAKTLTHRDLMKVLKLAGGGRHGQRNRVMVLLSVKAGLRAGEIAALRWPMVCDARGRVGHVIEVWDQAAKNHRGRIVPMHPEIHAELVTLGRQAGRIGPVIRSERGGAMRAASVVNWFASLYRTAGLAGCSSHSGRRTFVTNAARLVARAGGSLRDVQQLAGHASIAMTQRYIEGDDQAKRRLVRML
ncbi:tyrosine-type recombinase/integrase [Novispirillum sp. DQ9]|uniref:tyrosine-type recombinase/integrase n=1 Tax=Novispirillum sp. DQ9 TaxID=3398612 RepID=UPI003C7B60F0